ncbi:MAG: U32 family peptidase [Ruminococcaceae bacterium]|nr:U32 family peptidase [Oscillospiraceae bacterium]
MHELLAPAGSFAALQAAVEAGADAVYLGPTRHNARLGGENFTEEAIRDAVRYCHLRHKKVYMTLNTLLSDRELAEMNAYAYFLAESGIDAVIVQDIGTASLLRAAVPALPLHASTQMTVHNAYGIVRAQELGMERVVLSREAFSKELIRKSPIEIEVFIHGALCVSYSGQCYFSSMLASRSGNRGTCAQPCRHRYQNGYALSLHDLCLAQHIPELLSLPIASLKIEGRLKSPDYVRGVVSVYRQLLDEGRAATREEMDFLARLFSRQGFTDGYFTGKKGRTMFGYRTEADKRASQEIAVPLSTEKKIPLSMHLTACEGKPIALQLSDGVYAATVTGDTPQKATNRPVTEADCKKSLSKTGGTPYVAHVTADVAPDLFLSAASLNALRRSGLAALEKAAVPVRSVQKVSLSVPHHPAEKTGTHCIFQTPGQIPDSLQADFIWLPLFAMEKAMGETVGAILPTIIFDSEMEPVKKQLEKLRDGGLRHVMCQTIGQSLLCREMGLLPHGGTGLHIYNSRSAQLSDMESLIASPELLASQLQKMPKPRPLSVMIYGRHTLMTMENCLAQVHDRCHERKNFYPLTDEKGNVFPVLCAYPHRNEVLNARPLYMLDKLSTLRDIGPHAFVLRFTTETKREVEEIMALYRAEAPSPFPFTRGCFFPRQK